MTGMSRLGLAAAGISMMVLAAPAVAMPVAPGLAPSSVEQVKIICEQDGFCYRPAKRRPVARWIYGDNVFTGGPYVGPGFYGAPNYHYRWGWYFGN